MMKYTICMHFGYTPSDAGPCEYVKLSTDPPQQYKRVVMETRDVNLSFDVVIYR